MVRLLDEKVSAEELATLDSVDSSAVERKEVLVFRVSVYERFRRWAAPIWKPATVSLSLILIVAAAWASFLRNGPDNVVQSGGSERTFEARLSGQPCSEFTHTRSG